MIKYSQDLLLQYLKDNTLDQTTITAAFIKQGIEINSHNNNVWDLTIPHNRKDCNSHYGLARCVKSHYFPSVNLHNEFIPLNLDVEGTILILQCDGSIPTTSRAFHTIEHTLTMLEEKLNNDWVDNLIHYVKVSYGVNTILTKYLSLKFITNLMMEPCYERRDKLDKKFYVCCYGSYQHGTEVEPNAVKKALSFWYQQLKKIGINITQRYGHTSLERNMMLPFSIDKIRDLISPYLKTSDMVSALSSRGYMIGSSYTYISAPIYRHDIVSVQDIAEDIVQMLSYDSFVDDTISIASSLQDLISFQAQDQFDYFITYVDKMVGMGFTETKNLPFSDLENSIFPPVKKEDVLSVINPLNKTYSSLRVSLLPGLFNQVQFNRNQGQDRIMLFEVGKVFLQKEEEILLSGVVYDSGLEQETLVGREMANLRSFLPSHILLQKNDRHGVDFFTDSKYLGQAGYNQEKNIFYFELKLSNLTVPRQDHIHIPSKFPAVTRDFSLLVEQEIWFNAIEQVISEQLQCLVELIDVYKKQDKKVLTVRVTYQSFDRTLTDQDIKTLVTRTRAILMDLGEVV